MCLKYRQTIKLLMRMLLIWLKYQRVTCSNLAQTQHGVFKAL